MASEAYLDQVERQLCQQIEQLRQRHWLELQPYLTQLSDLRAMRVNPYMLLVGNLVQGEGFLDGVPTLRAVSQLGHAPSVLEVSGHRERGAAGDAESVR